jgi:hypothetical protein
MRIGLFAAFPKVRNDGLHHGSEQIADFELVRHYGVPYLTLHLRDNVFGAGAWQEICCVEFHKPSIEI